MVESRLPKPLVAGSIPVSRSTFNMLISQGFTDFFDLAMTRRPLVSSR